MDTMATTESVNWVGSIGCVGPLFLVYLGAGFKVVSLPEFSVIFCDRYERLKRRFSRQK